MPQFLSVYIEQLILSPHRPRVPLPWPSADAVASAKTRQFVDPIVVRSTTTGPADYEILTGEQYWLLAQKAELEKVDVVVRTGINDQMASQLIIQGLSGQPNPIVEATAIKRLIDQGLTVTAAAHASGLTRTVASHLLRLLKLSDSVQGMIRSGALTQRQARPLLRLEPALQASVARQIIIEQLTVRDIEALLRGESITRPQHPKQGPGPRSVASPAATKDPNTRHLETELSQLIGAPVTLTEATDGQGELTIRYANWEILDGLLGRLGYRPDHDH